MVSKESPINLNKKDHNSFQAPQSGHKTPILPTVPPQRQSLVNQQLLLQQPSQALQHLLKQQPPDLLNFLASDSINKSPTEVAQRLAAALSAQAAAQVAEAQKSAQDKESNNNRKRPLNNNIEEESQEGNGMKVPPISLAPPSGHNQLGLPFNPDFLWRFPNPYMQQPPPSPLEAQFKSRLPGGLGHDPRCWSREDVNVFLRCCESEFDLEKIDMEKFQMNGKALCLLSKTDLAGRCAGAGDVIHNILQMLIRETAPTFPPSSPLTPRPPLMTPTSPAVPLSPHPWPLLSAAAQVAAASAASDTFPNLSHLISQTNSVTLSPANSAGSHQNGDHRGVNGGSLPPLNGVTSEASSIHALYPPPQLSQAAQAVAAAMAGTNGTNNNGQGTKRSHSASSSHSDSEDSASSPDTHNHYLGNGSQLSPKVPNLSRSPTSTKNDIQIQGPSSSSKDEATPELNTNGRLLWDFLQQLLNDSQQRYTSYIAWKNKETGVFKIVDPAGLAKLWGIQKNHLSMNYDKMSRALRYYYRVNILRKVQGERHCYQFLRNPSELKSIKNISLLRQQMEAQAAAHKIAAQHIANLRGLSPHVPPSPPSSTSVNPIQIAQESSSSPDTHSRAARDLSSPPPLQPIHPTSSDDLPTDLTMDPSEKKARLRERLERESHNQRTYLAATASTVIAEVKEEDDKDQDKVEARSTFDYRGLMPQVSVKTENC